MTRWNLARTALQALNVEACLHCSYAKASGTNGAVGPQCLAGSPQQADHTDPTPAQHRINAMQDRQSAGEIRAYSDKNSYRNRCVLSEYRVRFSYQACHEPWSTSP